MVPLSGGLVGLCALRCYVETCAFTLSAQAHGYVWDLAEYKRVKLKSAQPARHPEGQASSENCCGHTTLKVLLCARALSFA